MFISPKTAIQEGWVTHPNCKVIEDWFDHKFLNPNALDFTLDAVYTIASANAFIIDEENKMMRGGAPHLPIADRVTSKEYWFMKGKSVYDCMSDLYVEVPEGVACQLIIRSTFSRNGLFLTSGLYDSGFKGNIGFAIHNNCEGIMKVGVGTRIGQIIFVESASEGVYAGQYNHEAGTAAPHQVQ